MHNLNQILNRILNILRSNIINIMIIINYLNIYEKNQIK
jgi:hypothetical protein